jgi:hypothetical protein
MLFSLAIFQLHSQEDIKDQFSKEKVKYKGIADPDNSYMNRIIYRKGNRYEPIFEFPTIGISTSSVLILHAYAVNEHFCMITEEYETPSSDSSVSVYLTVVKRDTLNGIIKMPRYYLVKRLMLSSLEHFSHDKWDSRFMSTQIVNGNSLRMTLLENGSKFEKTINLFE